MSDSDNGMVQEHSRSTELHDLPDRIPHLWFITVNAAGGAERLVLFLWTLFNAVMSIPEKRFAWTTEFMRFCMILSTV